MSTRRFPRALAGMALAGFASAIAAAEPRDRGWSIEANVLEAESSGEHALYLFDSREPGRSVRGSYAFSRHFALQAGYYDLGEHVALGCRVLVCPAVFPPVQPDQPVDIAGVSLAAVGTWPVTDRLELFGKLGVLGWDADFQTSGVEESDRGALASVGVGIWVSPKWRLDVQYEHVDFDLESAGIGATYRF